MLANVVLGLACSRRAAVLGVLSAAALAARPAAAQSPPYLSDGTAWIGTASACAAPNGWTAGRLFHGKLPSSLAGYCRYVWNESLGPRPSSGDVLGLFTGSGASALTEDAPVVVPQGAVSALEEDVRRGLRAAMHQQLGDVSLLPVRPTAPVVRIAVIDSAPDAVAGAIVPGTNRHGDTLAHLIEDAVCGWTQDGVLSDACAAEVVTVLALPWARRGVPAVGGGNVGTLGDLALAIERALSNWRADRQAHPTTTPVRLVLNLSLGWEDLPGIADCGTGPADGMAPPARAVRAILQHAAGQGVMVVAAAGNDSGGPTPRTGLICPGRFQAVPQDVDPTASLVTAASGVDYADQALATARPGGITGVVAPGLGGVAWAAADVVPPALTGSSVSAAAVSAIAALVWAYQPSLAAADVIQRVYSGGVEVGAAAACPLRVPSCKAHRASVCGALHAAGATVPCAPAERLHASAPPLPAELTALTAGLAIAHPSAVTSMPLNQTARYRATSAQVAPWVFPQPIAATCPTCVVSAASTSGTSLWIPALSQALYAPAVVVDTGAGVLAWSLGTMLPPDAASEFPVPVGTVVSAYLTGLDVNGASVTEQLVVDAM